MEFQQTELHRAIKDNDIEKFNELLLKDDLDFQCLDINYQTYLHVGITNNCDVTIVAGLLPRVRIGQRDASRRTALDYALVSGGQYSSDVLRLHTEYILQCLKDGEYEVLWQLATDGWMHWPVKGISQIEKFAEAPFYLAGMTGHLSFNGQPAVLPLGGSQDPNFDTLLEEIGNNSKNDKMTNEYGMTALHIAIITRDKSRLLKELKHDLDNLLVQDSVGRLPLHYACALKNSTLRQLIDTAYSEHQDCYDIKDVFGHTPKHYQMNKNKIDFKKITSLINYTTFCFASAFVGNPMLEFVKFARTTPMLDGSGRNYLHKLVITSEDENDVDPINAFMKDDVSNYLKGKDLWGRTPIHYAYMVNPSMVQYLLKKRAWLNDNEKEELIKIEDIDGKIANDFDLIPIDNNEAEKKNFHRKLQRDKLSKTIKLMSRILLTRFYQEIIIKEMIEITSVREDTDMDLESSTSSLSAKVADIQIHSTLQEQVAVSKLPSGIPLFFYIMLLSKYFDKIEKVLEYFETKEFDCRDSQGRNLTLFMEAYRDEENIYDIEKLKPLIEDLYSSQKKPFAAAFEANTSRQMSRFKNYLSKPLSRESNRVKSPSDTYKQEKAREEFNTKKIPKTTIAKLTPPSSELKSQVNGPALDSEYLKRTLGQALGEGLGMIALLQPLDPIEYLANYLYKHAENVQMKKLKEQEDSELIKELQRYKMEQSEKAVLKNEMTDTQKVSKILMESKSQSITGMIKEED